MDRGRPPVKHIQCLDGLRVVRKGASKVSATIARGGSIQSTTDVESGAINTTLSLVNGV